MTGVSLFMRSGRRWQRVRLIAKTGHAIGYNLAARLRATLYVVAGWRPSHDVRRAPFRFVDNTRGFRLRQAYAVTGRRKAAYPALLDYRPAGGRGSMIRLAPGWA